MLQASGPVSGGLSGSWTWAAVFAGIAVVITVISVCLTIVHRRRTILATLLEPVDSLLDDAAVELAKLATLPATKDSLDELSKLLNRIKQAEKAFPSIPVGTVVANIEEYEQTVLPDDFAEKLTATRTAEQILTLSRQQGARIVHVQASIDTVQDVIKTLRKR
ncbi:hypothetical protein IQ62_08550 [Streptomyces scabiei]|uniref:hypothetical protein n=1 Tax=Streptomyces scabiei TaxID=1930 RepID=UPI0004E670AA|nr:hypothetical protein [Streptomyces scabiei]KFG01303.1 hypothetical protein IQ62_08550 [Streptomyces scabiei]